ncbi:MAG: cytochrome C, partial [Thermoplasmata archaeon]
MFVRASSAIVALVLLMALKPLNTQTPATRNGFDLVDKTGNIRKPADVRDLYQLLGAYDVLLDPNGEQMHVTYASRGAAKFYRESGKFADGTVLVKEVFG